jgi:selenocysteine lyase/cysteine desulfurase
MAHQVTVSLTDEEFYTLPAEVREDDDTLAMHLHGLLFDHAQTPRCPKRTLATSKDVALLLYEAGLIDTIPTGRRDTPEEAAERKRLARLFGVGPDEKTASETIIEDRGLRE